MNLRAVVPVTGCHSSFLFVFEWEVCYHRSNYNEEKAGSEESQPAAVPKKGRRHLTGGVTVKIQKLEISGIPALLYGKESRKVYLYVHGKMGCKEEALPFAELACPAGYQVLAVDLPEHGERRAAPRSCCRGWRFQSWKRSIPMLQSVGRMFRCGLQVSEPGFPCWPYRKSLYGVLFCSHQW